MVVPAAVSMAAQPPVSAVETVGPDAAYTLKDQQVEVGIDAKGCLTTLQNLRTGHNYAAGQPLWRLYFDRKDGPKENEVRAQDNVPEIRRQGDRLELRYPSLKMSLGELRMSLVLTVRLEEGLVRFGSTVSNGEPHTIIRELHYPLVGACQLPSGHKLLTTQNGGQLYPDPKGRILSVGNSPPYMAPSQFYRQMDLKYPGHTSANCFALVGETQGLYFGSHDATFQDTWHGLRLYPDASGAFTALEAGLYKYPHCPLGHTWTCEANVVAPYAGSWHQTSKTYRKWADTWWRHREAPLWVRKMKGWQRINLAEIKPQIERQLQREKKEEAVNALKEQVKKDFPITINEEYFKKAQEEAAKQAPAAPGAPGELAPGVPAPGPQAPQKAPNAAPQQTEPAK